jgi:hypothetical protein
MTQTTNNATPETSTASAITVGGKNYPLDSLSEAARTQVNNVRLVDAEVNRLQNQINIAQAARISFINALQAEIAKG